MIIKFRDGQIDVCCAGNAFSELDESERIHADLGKCFVLPSAAVVTYAGKIGLRLNAVVMSKQAIAKRHHDDNHLRLSTHVNECINSYHFARRLKTSAV